jgi:hypothetical protein
LEQSRNQNQVGAHSIFDSAVDNLGSELSGLAATVDTEGQATLPAWNSYMLNHGKVLDQLQANSRQAAANLFVLLLFLEMPNT